MTEGRVQAWVDDGRLVPVVGEAGEPRLRLADEGRSGDGAYESGFSILELRHGSDDDWQSFRAELDRERRACKLADLDAGEVDVDALADVLVDRLTAVVPASIVVSARMGIV